MSNFSITNPIPLVDLSKAATSTPASRASVSKNTDGWTGDIRIFSANRTALSFDQTKKNFGIAVPTSIVSVVSSTRPKSGQLFPRIK